MLVNTLLVALLLATTSSYMVDNQPGSSCGCAVERHFLFNEQRIPSMITEWNCQNVGASCGSAEAFIPSKCRQLTGLLDVGYTSKIGNQELVVNKRNLTVGIGCVCQPMEIKRVQQIEEVENADQMFQIYDL
eukprot:00103.XXX_810_1264_1 [CDS] Oithona nana genome sequencing.